MASTTSSSQMINSKDMVLKDEHHLNLISCGPKSTNLIVRIDKSDDDIKVYLVNYLELFRVIEKYVVPGLYEFSLFIDTFQYRAIKSEELNELVVNAVSSKTNSHTERWIREINRIFKLITSNVILETCYRIQLAEDSGEFNAMKAQCYIDGFLRHSKYFMTIKKRYPHIDLSFLKDERFSQEIKELHSFLRSEDIDYHNL